MKRDKGYMVADVETTIRNTTFGKNKAFPFAPVNQTVAIGTRTKGVTGRNYATETIRSFTEHHPVEINTSSICDIDLMVGHNIKFDLHYLCKEGATINGVSVREWMQQGAIWDTQQVEYILSGQSHLYPSLDECSVKYGGNLKDDRIKILWQAGVATEDIQEPMLNEYLFEDIENTDIVFEEQMERVRAAGLLPLVRSMNQAIMGYQEMEFNGMKIDIDRLNALANQNKLALDLCKDDILYMIPTNIRKHINIGSTQQMSNLLFGGTFKYKVKEKVGVYKNGNDKYKLVEYVVKNPLFDLASHAQPGWKLKNGTYQTTDFVLETIKSYVKTHSREHQFISLLQEFRTLEKERSGYYESIPNLIIPDDECLHQNINTCATHTGRLSQSDPNLQNTAKKGKTQVKSMFVSRFGDLGFILEADYKQLEVIALAFVSGDIQLITDILSGTDVHTETHNKVRRWLPSSMSEEDQRRKVKSVNFGLIYGGGANTLAKQSGLEVSVVKKIIKAFYARYPGVKEYQQQQEARLVKLVPNGKTEKGFPRKTAKLISATGRRYTFNEYDNAPWAKRATGKDTSFSWTQLCNYECQGFATGDIVPTVIGYLYKELVNDPELRDLCLMINTVHDSIIFDIHYSVLDKAAKTIKRVMEAAPDIMEEVYGIKIGLPLKVELTAGPNWKHQRPIDELLEEV